MWVVRAHAGFGHHDLVRGQVVQVARGRCRDGRGEQLDRILWHCDANFRGRRHDALRGERALHRGGIGNLAVRGSDKSAELIPRTVGRGIGRSRFVLGLLSASGGQRHVVLRGLGNDGSDLLRLFHLLRGDRLFCGRSIQPARNGVRQQNACRNVCQRRLRRHAVSRRFLAFHCRGGEHRLVFLDFVVDFHRARLHVHNLNPTQRNPEQCRDRVSERELVRGGVRFPRCDVHAHGHIHLENRDSLEEDAPLRNHRRVRLCAPVVRVRHGSAQSAHHDREELLLRVLDVRTVRERRFCGRSHRPRARGGARARVRGAKRVDGHLLGELVPAHGQIIDGLAVDVGPDFQRRHHVDLHHDPLRVDEAEEVEEAFFRHGSGDHQLVLVFHLDRHRVEGVAELAATGAVQMVEHVLTGRDAPVRFACDRELAQLAAVPAAAVVVG
mmetsp:Transcript_15903/g.39323  ORF Transcript_15903/g.39323 Transcript_15903/m.39323 type:complete len:440 (+) Transcript_15903:1094-2413(+)